MKVSIIIPTFKDSYFIKNFSLRSVLSQTYSNFEVIIGSDGENNELQLLIESLGDSRIRYLEFDKSTFKDDVEKWCVGGAYPRNRCLDLITGNLVAPLDHDDIWGPSYLEDRVNFFKSNSDIEFTYSKANFIKDCKLLTTLGKPKGEQIPHLSVVYLSKYNNLKYKETGKTAADYLLWKDFKDIGIKMTFIDSVTCIYNGKNNSLSAIENLYLKTFGTVFKVI